jgi:hypothetical protein
LERLDLALEKAKVERERVRHEARTAYDAESNGQQAGAAAAKRSPPDQSDVTIFPLDRVEELKPGAPTQYKLDGNELASTAIAPKIIDGVAGKAIDLSGDFGFLELKDVGLIDVADSISAALWIRPHAPPADEGPKKTRVLLGTAGNKNQFWRGWEMFIDEAGRLAVRLIHARPDNLIHVRSQVTVEDGRWTHVAFAYDGAGSASGVTLFIDGKRAEQVTVDDRLTRTIFPAKSAPGYPRDKNRTVRAGRSYRSFGGDFGIYQGALDDIRIFRTALTELEAISLYEEYNHDRKPNDRDVEESQTAAANSAARDARFEHWLQRERPAWQAADAHYRKLLSERVKLASKAPQLMVMQEMSEGRSTFTLERGEYDRPRERVSCGALQAVLPWTADRPQNRLGLAQWLFDPQNPLTARVAVNRYWQLLFGQGLVRSTHDFGNQGDRPTHPELLDWLAVRFRDSAWDVRALLKLMVMSSAYRQSSSSVDWQNHNRERLADASNTSDAVVPDPTSIDPGNRLLWRGASFRLSAEAIRDSALAASGLLVRKVGGPSVRPYQPPGLWTEKNNFSQDLADYVPDQGEGLYRRSLYTIVRRTSPPPSMITLDATDRSVCTVKRETTNTPLQALVLFNDPQFVEASRVLAERVQQPTGKSDDDCLVAVFLALAGREATSEELLSIKRLYDESLARFEKDAAAAESLLSVGEQPREKNLDAARTAALTVVTNTIMNFDDFYMRR